jgi:hypothetical protein
LIVDIKLGFQAWARPQEYSHPTASLQLCIAPLPQVTSAVGEIELLANPLIILGSVDSLGGVNWMFLAIAYSIQSTDAVSFPYRNK